MAEKKGLDYKELLLYQCVGKLKDFYKSGITSYIMMKVTNNNSK